MRRMILSVLALLSLAGFAPAWACFITPVYISSARLETETKMSVRQDQSCGISFTLPGILEETRVVKAPKTGRALARNLRVYYAPRKGYAGPDEVTFAFIGKDQYGGPMHVTIKLNVTVTP